MLNIGDTENRFGPEWLAEVQVHLDAVGSGIVDAVAHEDDVLSAAIEMARSLVGKAGPTLGTIKTRMYAEALGVLRETDAPLE